VILDVGAVLAICDHFVIVSARNKRQVRTITDEIEKALTEEGGPKPLRLEGLDDLRWVLMDYGDFVVHVFLQEAREYYDLERLWSDVPRVAWADVATSSSR
jgi:ribosome-associated protein